MELSSPRKRGASKRRQCSLWTTVQTTAIRSLLDSGFRSLRSLGRNDTRTVHAKYASYPSFELAQGDLPDHQHAGRAVVEAGNRRKILAAIFLERVRVLDRDLLQRFQTIGGKAGRDHRYAFDAAPGELADGPVGRGLEPLLAAEARLKGHHQPRLVELERVAQEPHGLDAMGIIGVALFDIALGHAVER